MIRIEVNGLTEVQNMLTQLRVEKIPNAVKHAVNNTAFGLKTHLQGLIKTSVKNPHPSTVKNIFVVKADSKTRSYDTTGVYAARVHFDQLYRRGLNEYMLPLIQGSGRDYKPSEEKLGRYYVPAYKANPGVLNKYGNMRGGTVLQILSRLGANERYAGSLSNATKASLSKRTGAKKTLEYFVIGGRQKVNGLAPGVYQRQVEGRAVKRHIQRYLKPGAFERGTGGLIRMRGIKPVMIFANRQPTYKPIIPFFASGRDYVEKNLPYNVAKEIQFYISRGYGA